VVPSFGRGESPIVDVISSDFLYRTMDSIWQYSGEAQPRLGEVTSQDAGGEVRGSSWAVPRLVNASSPCSRTSQLNVVLAIEPRDARAPHEDGAPERRGHIFFEDR